MRNSTIHPVILPKKTALGSIQTLAKVIEANPPKGPKIRTVVSTASAEAVRTESAPWQPPVDLSYFTCEW